MAMFLWFWHTCIGCSSVFAGIRSAYVMQNAPARFKEACMAAAEQELWQHSEFRNRHAALCGTSRPAIVIILQPAGLERSPRAWQ
jgi:hypothetical protein